VVRNAQLGDLHVSHCTSDETSVGGGLFRSTQVQLRTGAFRQAYAHMPTHRRCMQLQARVATAGALTPNLRAARCEVAGVHGGAQIGIGGLHHQPLKPTWPMQRSQISRSH
jgi:hypothetical protein